MMEFDLENPLLTNFNDFHDPSLFFLLESQHMPTTDTYIITTLKDKATVTSSIRREAISSISQLFSCKFSPFLSYLAVNYLDRYLSSQGLLQQPKTWVPRLIAISCVSLAAKMNKIDFSLANFQGDGDFIFDVATINRMECIVLGALKWRMRSITPFSFISFFISFFNLNDPPLMHALKARAVEIILKAQIGIKFLEFKPSIIAASALLYASNELFPLQFSCFTKAISSSSYVNKENLSKCYDSIFGMVSSPNTSEDMVSRTERNVSKRRKINDHRNDRTVHLSQVQHC